MVLVRTVRTAQVLSQVPTSHQESRLQERIRAQIDPRVDLVAVKVNFAGDSVSSKNVCQLIKSRIV